MDATELEQLRVKVAQLEARLEPAPAMLPVAYRPDPVYTPPVTVRVAELQASGPLRYLTVPGGRATCHGGRPIAR